MAISSVSLSLPAPISTFFSPKPRISLKFQNPSFQITSFSTSFSPPKKSQKNSQVWRIQVTPEDAVPPDTPIETTQQIVQASGDDGVSTIISTLLFIAFVGLTILTIGVIYIAVTDFLQKREKEKFEKEETANMSKKKKKKGPVRAKTGPRGFGQKVEEDDD